MNLIEQTTNFFRKFESQTDTYGKRDDQPDRIKVTPDCLRYVSEIVRKIDCWHCIHVCDYLQFPEKVFIRRLAKKKANNVPTERYTATSIWSHNQVAHWITGFRSIFNCIAGNKYQPPYRNNLMRPPSRNRPKEPPTNSQTRGVADAKTL